MMPFFLLGAAAGAVAAALFSHSKNEPNRQKAEEYRRKAEYYEREAEYYKNNYTNEKKQHGSYVAQSQDTVHDLSQKLAKTEEDKSGFRVVVRYQQDLISLMFDIDANPSREALREFHQAIFTINRVLVNLGEEQIAMPSDYFARNLARVETLEAESRNSSCLSSSSIPLEELVATSPLPRENPSAIRLLSYIAPNLNRSKEDFVSYLD